MAEFVPLAGPAVAGAVTVLVALATAGLDGTAILLVVAVLVQQFDNDLLAPVVHGRALNLHPVVALLAIATSGALFGLGGSFLSVPFTAVVVNVVAAGRDHRAQNPDERWMAAE